MEDPNSTILEEEPAAIAVVPPACTSDNSAGPSSRPGHAKLRCPVDGCFVTRRNEALLNLHVANSHQWYDIVFLIEQNQTPIYFIKYNMTTSENIT